MPIYEYECEKGHTFEVLQNGKDPAMLPCKYCRARSHRILSPVHFVLKGPGFYVNDYKKKPDPPGVPPAGTNEQSHESARKPHR